MASDSAGYELQALPERGCAARCCEAPKPPVIFVRTMKVHLVDGTFELFRCFHGAPRAKAADGREVGAGRAMLQTLTSLLRQPDTSHVAVAFDRVVPAARDPAAAGSPLREQTALCADIVRALGMVVWPMVRYQADDAIATAAARFKSAPGVEQVVICSNDNDFAQCVQGKRVVRLDRIHKRLLDEAGVVERFGVPPALIPDLFGLMGTRRTGCPGSRAGGRSPPPRCCARTAASRRSPTTPSCGA